MMEKETTIIAPGSGFEPGDLVLFSRHRSRLVRVLMVLWRPRVNVVVSVTEGGFCIAERKMTWTEFWNILLRTLTS